MVLWSTAGRQAAVHDLNLAQIAFEPLGVLLAVTSSPSPRCSVLFWPLDAPLAAWYLYGIEPPGPPGHPTPPGYSYLTGHPAPYLNS